MCIYLYTYIFMYLMRMIHLRIPSVRQSRREQITFKIMFFSYFTGHEMQRVKLIRVPSLAKTLHKVSLSVPCTRFLRHCWVQRFKCG